MDFIERFFIGLAILGGAALFASVGVFILIR
jgi:hypothetical protein